MSALAGSSHSEPHTTRWLIGGVIASVLLHLSVAVAYLWTPSFDFTPAPSASPIAVSLVAPLAAPYKITSDTQESVAVEASKPEATPQVEQQQPEITSPVTSQESKENPELQKHHQVPQKPKPKIKPVETKKKPEEKPKPKEQKPTQKVKTELEKKEEAVQPLEASAPQSVAAKNQSTALSAPRQGKTSEHERAAKQQWQQLLHAHLEKEKRYPRKAKRLRKQGMPVIRFTMNREGQVLDVELVRSSGTDSLDKEAMDLVYRAQPLIKPPQSVLGQQISLTVPIRFSF
ncbi:hypothetical protein TUMSATVNIG1_36300 [Vibrio nigripulchritudo]|uniref:energy transducer TonB n=1 Tax=Vibrio nigripulchritudo TaxID=28173 RepID=UPI00190B130E|nr:energy transducer TonB [Vibrio nigripulchritudo]BCL71664.1 hypothetical protein VNTUMSATTG_36010 [Vibrio nigripulchritudo]BDU33021.1 hypothetical protein TUMSATVNIG1_36300 [Vibrio nigripulchritudo]